jgi:WD40 repeat protein
VCTFFGYAAGLTNLTDMPSAMEFTVFKAAEEPCVLEVTGKVEETFRLYPGVVGNFTIEEEPGNVTNTTPPTPYPTQRKVAYRGVGATISCCFTGVHDTTSGAVTGVSISADMTLLATSSLHQQTGVLVWDIATETVLYTLVHSDGVTGVAFHPMGSALLASACNDNKAHVWEYEVSTIKRSYEGHIGDVNGVAWSPDGQQLATASDDDDAKIWSVATGLNQATLEGHTRSVMSVAFSPDGLLLVSGSDDGTAKVWKVLTGDLVATLVYGPDTTGAVKSVAFNPEFSAYGYLIATTGLESDAKLWDGGFEAAVDD